MILSHLARFLSLLVCLTPRAWKTEYMLYVLPLSPSLFLCMCVVVTNTYTKIFVCTLKYLSVGVCKPWVLALCFIKKKTQQPLCCCTCHPQASQLHHWPLPGMLDPRKSQNGPLCAEWVSRSEQKAGWRLSAGCVESQSQSTALRWVTCKEEMTARDAHHLQCQAAQCLTHNNRLKPFTLHVPPWPFWYYKQKHSC